MHSYINSLLYFVIVLLLLACKKEAREILPPPVPGTSTTTFVMKGSNQVNQVRIVLLSVTTDVVGRTKKATLTGRCIRFTTTTEATLDIITEAAFSEINQKEQEFADKNLIDFFEGRYKAVIGYAATENLSQQQIVNMLRGGRIELALQRLNRTNLLEDVLLGLVATPSYAQNNPPPPMPPLRPPSPVLPKPDMIIYDLMNGVFNQGIDCFGGTNSKCLKSIVKLGKATTALWDFIADEFTKAIDPNHPNTANNLYNNVLNWPLPAANPAATASGGAWGDPHFTTFDGSYYDFQGVGEFVAAKSTTDKLELQVRQQAYGTSKMVSVNTALAFNTGSDVVAVYLNPKRIVINNREAGLTFTDIGLGNGGRVTKNGDALEIRTNNGDVLKVSFTPDFLNYVLLANRNRQSKLAGLLGNFDGNRLNDIATRAGLTVNPTEFKTFYSTFSDSWRITQNESLFEYDSGKTTDSYTNRNFPETEYTVTQTAYQQAFRTCTDAGINTEPALSSCIYDVALTGKANWASYYLDIQKTFTSAGLIAYYPFNGNANDASGNNNHGEVFGEAPLTTDRNGKANSAYSFNGRNQFIRVANSRLLHGLGQQVTLSAWVLWKSQGEASILCKASSSVQQLQFFFYRNSSTKETYFHTNGGTVGASRFLLDIDKWYHVAMVIDGTARRFYVNGDLVGTVTGYPLIGPNFSPLEIGRDFFGATELHQGFLDDIRIYNKVLSDQEVKALSDINN